MRQDHSVFSVFCPTLWLTQGAKITILRDKGTGVYTTLNNRFLFSFKDPFPGPRNQVLLLWDWLSPLSGCLSEITSQDTLSAFPGVWQLTTPPTTSEEITSDLWSAASLSEFRDHYIACRVFWGLNEVSNARKCLGGSRGLINVRCSLLCVSLTTAHVFTSITGSRVQKTA